MNIWESTKQTSYDIHQFQTIFNQQSDSYDDDDDDDSTATRQRCLLPSYEFGRFISRSYFHLISISCYLLSSYFL